MVSFEFPNQVNLIQRIASQLDYSLQQFSEVRRVLLQNGEHLVEQLGQARIRRLVGREFGRMQSCHFACDANGQRSVLFELLFA